MSPAGLVSVYSSVKWAESSFCLINLLSIK